MPIDVTAPGDAVAARKRRPAWVPTLAAFVTIAVCLAAASWQHRRLLEKENLQRAFDAAVAAAAVPFPSGVSDWSAWRFRTVMMDGQFDARHQILIDNVQHAGRVGFDVVAPFRLHDGRTVLVVRGFAAAGSTRAVLPSPAVPQGTIMLQGRIDIPSQRYLELGGPAPPTGPLWQHLDPRKFAQATGVDVLPIVVRSSATAGDDGLVSDDDALPAAGAEKHLSYMMQWYAFAAMAGGLWLWFTVRPWVRARSRR